jgi:hypothetical protein
MSLRPTHVLVLLALPACTPKEVPPGTTDTATTDTDTTDTDTDTQLGDDDDDDDDNPVFDAHVVGNLPNPVHANVGDLDGDGQPEIVVSSYGAVKAAEVPPGVVTVFTRGADLATWTAQDVVTPNAGVEFPGHPTLDDVDGDGDIDIVLPSGGILCESLPEVGPCGGLAWMENPGGVGPWTPHVVVTNSAAFYVAVSVDDIDLDGIDDWVTVGERVTGQIKASEVHWFRGLGGGNFDPAPNVVATGAAPWPTVVDLDGDGDRDIVVGGRYAPMPAFAWISHDGGPVWTTHPIDDTLGRGFVARLVADLYGDGVLRLVATNHTNTVAAVDPDPQESVAVAIEVPPDPTGVWPAPDVLSEGIESLPEVPLFPNEAPGTFATGDIDRDGDLDVVVAGDGDPTVYLLEQTAPGTFATRVLRTNVGQSGGTHMVDLDGDGYVEIVCVSLADNSVFVIEYLGG